MKYLSCISFFLFGCCNLYGQKSIKEDLNYVGQLFGPVQEMRIVFRNTTQYHPASQDTCIYHLNNKRNTAIYIEDSLKGRFSMRMYNLKGQLIRAEWYEFNKKTKELEYNPNHNPPMIKIDRTNSTVDTTKYYYDKRGRLIKTVMTDNDNRIVMTNKYRYDKYDNEIESLSYTFRPEADEKEWIREKTRTLYSYDKYGNWTFREKQYLSINSDFIGIRLTAWRTIKYR